MAEETRCKTLVTKHEERSVISPPGPMEKAFRGEDAMDIMHQLRIPCDEP